MALSDMMSASNVHVNPRSRSASYRNRCDMSGHSRLPSTTADQFSDEVAGNRLIDNFSPLMTVILSVIVSRVSLGDAFLHVARSSNESFDLRELAFALPMPRLATHGDRFCADVFDAARGTVRTVFTGEVQDVKAYLNQLVKRSNAMGEDKPSNSVYLLMLIYLDRLFARCPSLMLTSTNVKRMVAAAYTVAFKVLEDVNWGVSGLSVVVDVDWKDLCALESSFLKLLDYRVNVGAEEFRAAESTFAAEALEGYGGARVLSAMHSARVMGIEDAVSQARNWLAVLPPSAYGGMELLNGLNGSTIFCGVRSIWRTREPTDPIDFEREWGLRRTIFGLAFSQFIADFGQLLSSLVRGGEEEAEWQVAGVCERPGLERYRMLRSLLVFQNYSVTKLPPMVKRPVPFTVRAWNVEKCPELSFTAGLGPSGNFLVRDGWNAALAPPSPEEEARDDAELAMRFSSPMQPVYSYLENIHQEDAEDIGLGCSYEGGIRVSLTGSPCTPVGPRGGVISVNFPNITSSSFMEQNHSLPETYASQTRLSSPPSIPPPHSAGTAHLADYFYRYASAEATRSAVPAEQAWPILPFSHQSEEESASTRVRRMQHHFDAVRPGESLFSYQPFLNAAPSVESVGRPGKWRGQVTGGSPTHIMGNVGRRRDDDGSTAARIGTGVGCRIIDEEPQLCSQRKRTRGSSTLGDRPLYHLDVRW